MPTRNKKGQFMARKRRRTRAPARRTTTRRRSKPKVNLLNVAQSTLVANAILAGATGNGIVGFLTDTKGGGSSFTLTAREMVDYFVGGGKGGIYAPSAMKAGIDATPQAVMLRNIKENWLNMTIASIGIPAGFHIAKKVLRKPLLSPMNKAIKMTGLDVKV